MPRLSPPWRALAHGKIDWNMEIGKYAPLRHTIADSTVDGKKGISSIHVFIFLFSVLKMSGDPIEKYLFDCTSHYLTM